MDSFLALMAMIGMLTTSIALSYPIGYVIEKVIAEPYARFTGKREEWHTGNR